VRRMPAQDQAQGRPGGLEKAKETDGEGSILMLGGAMPLFLYSSLNGGPRTRRIAFGGPVRAWRSVGGREHPGLDSARCLRIVYGKR